MIGVYNYTVFLTYLGFASGILGIVNAFNGKVFPAIMCLMFSGLCDMFDGKVARTKKDRTIEERHFCVQLDSLSDVVCFGVLPAVIGYAVGLKENYMLPLIIFFPLAALIRLAWFNVLEIVRNSNDPVKTYTRLTVTAAALVFPFIYIFKNLIGKYFALIYGLVLLIVGILFISKIKIKKPGFKVMLMFIAIGIIEVASIIVVKFIK